MKIIIESQLEAIANTLQEGHNIELRGFGRFKIKKKAARTARNPRTGGQVQIPEGYKTKFQASRKLNKVEGSTKS